MKARLLILFLYLLPLSSCAAIGSESPVDRKFEEFGKRFVREFPAHSPVSATLLGDHRFDGKLNEVSPESRARQAAFLRRYLEELEGFPRAELSRPNQVDAALLENDLRYSIWRLEELQEWAWNPLSYTRLTGNAVYGLMARDFAPLRERLNHVADRLKEFPRLLEQIRKTLIPRRVPKVHAETAVKQNRGVLSILDNMVKPHLGELAPGERENLQKAMETAREAVERHQEWLEKELLPGAAGDFRLGAELYDRKLAFTLHSPLTRQEIRKRAEGELLRVRSEMYEISREVYKKEYPYTEFPREPTRAYEQAIIRAGLEMAYRETPARDEMVDAARRSLQMATEFVRKKDLVTIPPDPVEIIIMPEFQRGISLAYCDSPGPLDVGQKTFYAVAPLPGDWTEKQVRSFLREYNTYSINDLTIHEAMPGHFLQLAHSNRYPSMLRTVLSSGTFIEGWAVYAEQMMAQEGFMGGSPLQKLIALKWYLRGIGNALIDQAIHAGSMTRDEALKLMIEDTFQEEREAAAKWVRAQLTSAQLSTYFVGYLEHTDLRREMEKDRGEKFSLKEYHDRLLSFGSPPVQFVRALLLDLPIPR
jgi:uncharacterized protein (DUF885 family)